MNFYRDAPPTPTTLVHAIDDPAWTAIRLHVISQNESNTLAHATWSRIDLVLGRRSIEGATMVQQASTSELRVARLLSTRANKTRLLKRRARHEHLTATSH